MKTICTFFLAILSCIGLFAQKKVDMFGSVTDTTGTPMISATVVLLQAADSTLEAYSITDEKGHFHFRKLSPGEYLLIVSYVGYDLLYLPIQIDGDSSVVDAGTLVLHLTTNTLETVEVKAEHIPMRINKDTIEYNAEAFKILPHDVVEDLLKKLPGIEVESDGTILAQGKQVGKIMVDGKEFFGNNVTIATKNLPADAVDKVQVFEKKSEEAEFTGIDDGKEQRTINLTLKEDKKQGAFGNALLGGGGLYTTEGNYDLDRYEGQFNLNKFNETTQFSIIAGLNNTNNSITNLDDYINFIGGMVALDKFENYVSAFDLDILDVFMSDGTGLNSSIGAGVNLNSELGRSFLGQNTHMNFSYLINRKRNTTERSVSKENIVVDEQFSETASSLNRSTLTGHHFNLTLHHELDSMQKLILWSQLKLKDGNLDKTAAQVAFNGQNTSKSFSNSSSGSNRFNLFSNITYRRKFKRAGRSMMLGADLSKEDLDNGAQLFNILEQIPEDPSMTTLDTLNQRQAITNAAITYSLSMNWKEPLGKKQFLGFNLNHGNTDEQSGKNYYDRYPTNQEIFNNTLSTRFNRGYRFDVASISYILNGEKLNLTFSTSLQRSVLEGQKNADTPLERAYIHLLPRLSVGYELGNNKNIKLNYRTNVREPSLEQLQPVVDNSDPLNTYVGNPTLQPSFEHALGLYFYFFNPAKSSSLFAILDANYQEHPITNLSRVDEFFVRTVQPINSDKAWNTGANISYNTPVRSLGIKFQLSCNFHLSDRPVFVNEVENRIHTASPYFKLRINNLKQEIVEANLEFGYGFNKVAYSVSSELNRRYDNYNTKLELGIRPTTKWGFHTGFEYTRYPKTTFGEANDLSMWNISIRRSLMPSNRLELRFTVNDILNQNFSIRRSSQYNYLYEEQTRSLGRYFMLRLSYKISDNKPSDFDGGDGIIIIQE